MTPLRIDLEAAQQAADADLRPLQAMFDQMDPDDRARVLGTIAGLLSDDDEDEGGDSDD